MTVKPLEEDLRRMGLGPNEIRESLSHIGGSAEADLLGEDTEEDFEDDVYLSDMMDDEELDEVKAQRTHKMKGSAKADSKAYERSHKAQRKAARKRRARDPRVQAAERKRKAAGPARPHMRRSFMKRHSDVEDPSDGMPTMHESLMDELFTLNESIEREPTSRFEEYVEAFNHIADLGEMAAMEFLDEDDEAAADLLSLSLQAEAILQEMEDMGGALDADEDEELEASLADAMEDVGVLFDHYGLLAEDEDEDYEDEDELDEDEIYDYDNPFLDAAAGLREAKRPAKTKGRKVLNPGSTKTKKGRSKWGKSTTSSRQQLRGRADVRNVENLLGYLKKVKAGKVAPGAPLARSKTGKPLTKGARAAQKAAGKYKGA
jgi:hypothetical protein